jgi:hypothetical protein
MGTSLEDFKKTFRNPRYDEPTNTVIVMDGVANGQNATYHAHPNNPSPEGQQILAEVHAGMWGPIGPFVPPSLADYSPPPTPAAMEAMWGAGQQGMRLDRLETMMEQVLGLLGGQVPPKPEPPRAPDEPGLETFEISSEELAEGEPKPEPKAEIEPKGEPKGEPKPEPGE